MNVQAKCVYTLLLLPILLPAQSAEVRGVVHLRGGLGVSAAKVSAECIGSSASTDERGSFSLPNVTPSCRLLVSADGFQSTSATVADLALPLDIELEIDPSARPLRFSTPVPVNTNPELSTAIDTRTLSELPSSIRDINRFAMLDPRVRNTGSLGTDGIYGTRLTINGQLFRFTQYQMDGLSNYEPALGNGPQQVLHRLRR